jgi:hypothetical protein
MQTIYNAQGEAKECEAVDAREHIETGRWFNEAPIVEQVKEASSEQETQKRAYNRKT